MGAWIETRLMLKIKYHVYVAPHVGAWIETNRGRLRQCNRNVAPHVGAWIETLGAMQSSWTTWSLPTWERGLKQVYYQG